MSTTEPTETELVAYMRQRDEKRRKNIIAGVIVAVVVGIAGFAIHGHFEDQRKTDQFNQDQVDQFLDAMRD